MTTARAVLEAEAAALATAAARLGTEFDAAAAELYGARLVIVSGVGKSGYVARRVAATLTTTRYPRGVPASHGSAPMASSDSRPPATSR